jgi:hypothetical protein
MKTLLIIAGLMISTIAVAQPSTSEVWINEFHYDGVSNYGTTDVNEFVEIVVTNAIANNATELSKLKLVLYTAGAIDSTITQNGRGLPYNISSSWYTQAETEYPLSGFTKCPVAGTNFTILSKNLSILQDVPSAFAVVYNNLNVIQLLSYEKSFKIMNTPAAGTAAGMTTSLVTISGGAAAQETATTPTNHSISLLGTGTSYSAFTWNDGLTVTATPCALNTNTTTTQSFAVTLPVSWLSLNAIGKKDQIIVDWKVATESEISHYEVEFGTINSGFQKAGQVAVNRGSYKYTITQVPAGTYKVRIISINKTGKKEYSETRLVKLSSALQPSVFVYPNPVKEDKANLQITPTTDEQFTIEVLDVNGKLMQKQVQFLHANAVNTVTIDVSRLATGIYQLRAIAKGERYTTKLIIQ